VCITASAVHASTTSRCELMYKFMVQTGKRRKSQRCALRRPHYRKWTYAAPAIMKSTNLVPPILSTARTPIENHPSGRAHFAQFREVLLLLSIILLRACLLHSLDHTLYPPSFLLREVCDFFAAAAWSGHADFRPAVFTARPIRVGSGWSGRGARRQRWSAGRR
jgi:hypothetical protein